ncbi:MULTISPECIES: hypothetical protein [Pantoea]|jgi:hypothetical protein|uniref:hypothetical protein n=1 Tax=Pantoea TaxID=53335 RepID=UPI0009319994|nr:MULTISPECIES: hypothetical protein [Pantoea]MDJ0033753.1 hypothetical protein [Pantoea ananatis]MDJ0043073.1 hypothetical protein [Pantoea ananatis]PQK70281.1 hypothetical protein CG430_22020 [Pantoea ananatis]
MTLCLFLLVMSLNELFSLRHAAAEVRAGTVLLASAIILLPLTLAAPVLAGFWTAGNELTRHTLDVVSVSAQWTGAAAAVLLSGLYFILARRAGKRFWYTGAFIASALLAFIFANSLWFVSHSDAAIASPVLLGEGEEDCDAPAVLVRYHPDTLSDWRCPTGIVLMGESSHPFLPWPDYRQGKSRQMSDNISAIIKHAQGKSEKKAG